MPEGDPLPSKRNYPGRVAKSSRREASLPVDRIERGPLLTGCRLRRALLDEQSDCHRNEVSGRNFHDLHLTMMWKLRSINQPEKLMKLM
jgi:hypothetical protein